MDNFIRGIDLGLAYRKAKVDAYYSPVMVRFDFVEYEKKLILNLAKFKKQLVSSPNEISLGEWTYAPKGITLPEDVRKVIHSCPNRQWAATVGAIEKGKPKAEFRLMAQPSVDFHLLSALWMLKVGDLYDAKLGSSAYGNRLRRSRNGKVNPLSIGSFVPYLKPFREWHDNGIDALRTALAEGKKVVAITADVGGFYHELNPSFMLKESFLDAIDLKLTDEQRDLTEVFIDTLSRWAQSTPLKKGLPVGLPASGLVANMALIELDRVVERELAPLYYGRYVDDIILIMEDTSDFQTPKDVWEWICKRSNGLLKAKNEKGCEEAVSFAPDYLSDSRILFSNEKNKVFLIDGDSGMALIDSIAHHIRHRASEWRALPNLPTDPKHVAKTLVEAIQKSGEKADSLRKVDSLSLGRADFAIKLRDFEAYERDLIPEAWVEHRHAFLNAFIQHVMVLPKFFELADYLPRIIRLATACEDFELLRLILKRLFDLVDQVFEDCEISIKSYPAGDPLDEEREKNVEKEVAEKWKAQLKCMVSESIKISLPLQLSQTGVQTWREHMDKELEEKLGFDLEVRKLGMFLEDAFAHDLAHIPFRFAGLPPELSGRQRFALKFPSTLKSFEDIFPTPVTKGVGCVAKLMRFKCEGGLPFGLLFATRPLSIQELYILHPSPYKDGDESKLSEAILALRGFKVEKSLPCIENNGVLDIPIDRQSDKCKIAITSWETDITSWTASVTMKPDPGISRYVRLTKFLNEVLASSIPIDYLVMPELSVPSGWFLRIANKLRGKGISLICGVEYLHRRRRRVMNQVWVALPHDGLGFPSLAVYRQDKQRPALHEAKELFRVAGVVLKPEKTWQTPPILRHGNFQFSILICSELTNIAYRSALRGKIDALFIVEWNQDTESFNALVESSALDIHAYIIQCNDRQYGDSRIRVPHKDAWKRDHVRIKGGKNDYFVVGEIDIASLRAFQSNHRSPDGPFKPVPDGFTCAHDRSTTPR